MAGMTDVPEPDCSVTRCMVPDKVGVSITDRPDWLLLKLGGTDEAGEQVAVKCLIGIEYEQVPPEANPLVGRWICVTTDERGVVVSFLYSEECAVEHEPPPDNWRHLF